jgi:hypothetical protein
MTARVPSDRTATGLIVARGIGMLAAAAVPGAGAVTARALVAVAAEAILAAASIAWLRRSPASEPQTQGADRGRILSVDANVHSD